MDRWFEFAQYAQELAEQEVQAREDVPGDPDDSIGVDASQEMEMQPRRDRTGPV